MTDLEARIGRLEDLEAIKALKYFYGRCADEKYTADHRRKSQSEIDEMAARQTSVFTEDAIWDGGEQFGVRRGKEAIFNSSRAGVWRYAVHYFMSPDIKLDGHEATARWKLWQVGTLEQGATDVVLSATVDDRCVKVGERWLISHTRMMLGFMAPVSEGWADRRNMPFRLEKARTGHVELSGEAR